MEALVINSKNELESLVNLTVSTNKLAVIKRFVKTSRII